MSILNKAEEKSLRFYIGDVSGNDPFYGDPKAYVTINSLFFPNIFSESARAAEGKLLNPAVISDIPRLLSFFEGLFSAFGKAQLHKEYNVFRVERAADFELCRRLGETISMTSTSTAGFLDSYRDRRGIALMRFSLPEGSHCINAAETLDFYAKPEEAEILLPPFTELEITEVPMSDKEKEITDSDGISPKISVIAAATGIKEHKKSTGTDITACPAGIRVYEALNSGNIPDSTDVWEFSEWKNNFRSVIYSMLKSYTRRNCKMSKEC